MSSPNSRRQSEQHWSEEFQRRLAQFASRVLEICEELPDTKVGRHIRNQLLRSASAPGAHYAEARSAESADDFIHKTALAAKEARESKYWLQVTEGLEYSGGDFDRLLQESSELAAILFQSWQTARENRDS